MDYERYQSLVLWLFLPQILASVLHSVLGWVVPKRILKPAPANSQAYRTQRKWILSFVFLAFFAGECYQNSWLYSNRNLNYYDELGISASAPMKDIKRTYRRLSLNFHPDKVQADMSEQQKQKDEVRYESIKTAYETINNGNRRALYDRFGPQVIHDCPHCKVRYDYLQYALQHVVGFYIGTFTVSLIVGFLTQRNAWLRYYLLAWLLTAEIYFCCTRAEGSFLGRPSFEWIELLRHSVIAASLLFMQLMNIWSTEVKVDWKVVHARAASLRQEMEGWLAWQRKDLDQEKLDKNMDMILKQMQSSQPQAESSKQR